MTKVIDNTNLGYLKDKMDATYWPKTDVVQIGIDNVPTQNSDNLVKSGGVYSALGDKQDTLVSGTSIKTINNESLLGSGNISISGGGGNAGTLATTAQSTNASESLGGSVTLHKIAKTGTYSDLIGTPTNVSTFINDAGYTTNTGTITSVKMNGSTVASSGEADLGTVITSETSLSKGTTTGNGNAVTDISVSGHQITLTKGSTFLTSYTETDPVFTASAAYGISSSDITNWNAKQKAITVSSSEPTSGQGSNGDIWIVI